MTGNNTVDISTITAIIVSRRTLKLTRQCVTSLLAYYPVLPIVLVDNKSGEGHPLLQYCEEMSSSHPNITLVKNDRLHPHHGVGLNLGLREVSTPFFMTVDSDTVLQGAGVLEDMVHPFHCAPQIFATGHVWRNAAANCISKAKPGARTVDFVHPFFAMWDTEKFRRLKVGFSSAGMPTCYVCQKATEAGYVMYKINGIHPRCRSKDCVVRHFGGGTRARMGKERT